MDVPAANQLEQDGFRVSHPGVLVAESSFSKIDRHTVGLLKSYALSLPGKRARILLHKGDDSAMQEMIIAAPARTIWAPHLAAQPPKSWQVLEGSVMFVSFERGGEVAEIVPLGDAAPDGAIFLRIEDEIWHTIVPWSDMAVYKETLPGPRTDTIFADWGPRPDQGPEAEHFLQQIEAHLASDSAADS